MKLTRSYTASDPILGEHMRDVAEALARVPEVEFVTMELDPARLPLRLRLARVKTPQSVVVGNIAEKGDPAAVPDVGGVVWDRADGLTVRGLGGALVNGTVYHVVFRVEGA